MCTAHTAASRSSAHTGSRAPGGAQGRFGITICCSWSPTSFCSPGEQEDGGNLGPGCVVAAVKVLPRIEQNESAIQAEIRASEAARGSPFVVALLDALCTPNLQCLVYEQVPCGDLFSLLQAKHVLPPEAALFYAVEAAAGIAHLHSQRLIYRDLSLTNTLLDSSGHIKLCDFGSCFLPRSGDDAIIAHGAVGTPEFLAPEVLTTDGGYGQQVDWWALGVMLYELAVGRPPFWSDGPTADAAREEMYRQICHEEPHYPNAVPVPATDAVAADTALPGDMLDLLRGLLCKRPQDRFGLRQIQGNPFVLQCIGAWERVVTRSLDPPLVPSAEPSTPTGDNADEMLAISRALLAMAREARDSR